MAPRDGMHRMSNAGAVFLMLTGFETFVVITPIIVFMICAPAGPADKERYCLRCGEVTQWDPRQGCAYCAWQSKRYE